MPEDSTAQRAGTSDERSQSRSGEWLRPTLAEIAVFPTAERFSRVPSMFDSLGVQVPYTT